MQEGEHLKLFPHPCLRQQISECDREYIDELLLDLKERCRETPEELFKQLSHLSVGPLVTDSVESREFCAACLGAKSPLCARPE